MEIIGRIRMIGFAQQVSPTFTKRDVVITTEEQYPQHILIEFTQDKCDLLNQFQPGEMVRVGINLRGREWTNPQGEVRYFNSIQGWRINYKNNVPNNTNSPHNNNASVADAYFKENNNPTYGGIQDYGRNAYHQQEMFNGNLQPNSDPDDLPF